MTLEDKKGLYRASFANTFAEIEAPEGLWKLYLGCIGIGIGVTTLLFTGLIVFSKCFEAIPENCDSPMVYSVFLWIHPVSLYFLK